MSIYSFYAPSLTSFVLLRSVELSIVELKAQLNPLLTACFNDCLISSNEKIRQSLSVRLALQELLKQLGLPIVLLVKDENGRPFLKNDNLHISFSHTRYLVSVALSTAFQVGIDIETTRPQLAVVQSKILTKEESEHVGNSLDKLAIYWCAKEALYKCLMNQQSCNFQKIFVEPFQLQIEGHILAHFSGKKYLMHYKRIDCDINKPPHFCVCCEGHT